jgi:hypothetical protein
VLFELPVNFMHAFNVRTLDVGQSMPYVLSSTGRVVQSSPLVHGTLVAEHDRTGNAVEGIDGTRPDCVVEVGKDAGDLVSDGLERGVIRVRFFGAGL